MSRTVIEVGERVDTTNASFELLVRPVEPQNVADRLSWRTFHCDSTKAPIADLANVNNADRAALANNLITAVGEHIHTALTAHPGIGTAIDAAINGTTTATWPIEFHISALEAENLPLECIYHPRANFLGLDQRYALVRIVPSGTHNRVQFFTSALRMTAVLAADGITAIGEWQALRRAINQSGLDVQLTVLLAHDDLEAEISNSGETWVTTKRISGTISEFVQLIEDQNPQILHVFAHGNASNSSYLEIATPGSVSGLGGHPLAMELKHFAGIINQVWLVTLNACEGAAQTSGAHSLAYGLVAAGAPAAIGARETIDSKNANGFCQALYQSAFSSCRQNVLANLTFTPDWAPHMARARESLCGNLPGPVSQTAGQQKPWTLPVLYQTSQTLLIEPLSINENIASDEELRLTSQLQVLIDHLYDLHPDTPHVVKSPIVAEIDRIKGVLKA